MADVQVRKAIALRNVPGVELAAVGRWHASTGWVVFTQEDFANAVAALECPGVRNPVIKLGHDEEDSTSGVRWDGEPAVGWIGNMRMDGPKLIGDYMGMPEWLTAADDDGNAVLASAYPDRSIEIRRPFVCQVGHTHPSVITAVALCGVSRPGVGVLKSMQDVYAAFTVPVDNETEADTVKSAAASSVRVSTTVRLAAEPRQPTPVERRSGTDFEALATQWTEALDDLVEQWPEQVTQPQAEALAAQVQEAVAENPDALGELTVAAAAGGALLLAAMTAVAADAAAEQVAAAAAQGVTVPPPEPDSAALEVLALAVVGAMAASTASTAGRFAAQLLGSGTATEIADKTRGHLTGLGDRFLRDQMGGALSAAQNEGRLAVLRAAPAGRYYASEIADVDSCEACAAVDGTEFDDLDAAVSAYGSGKFAGCLGGPRCRGQLVTVWDVAAEKASAPTLHTTIRMSIGDTMPATVRASVSVEDISRKYYESAGYSMWITAMHVDPLELIAADDSSGKFFRIPVQMSGEEFTFGDPQEVAIVYENVAAARAALPHRWSDKAAALAAAGKKPDGTDLTPPAAEPAIASDVTPAGAAIRKMAATTTAPDAGAPAAGSTTEDKEASAMAVDPTKLREALGLPADAPQDDVTAALAALTSGSTTEPAAPATTPDPASLLSAIPADAGAIVLDRTNYEELVSRANQGVEALTRMRAGERDQVLNDAMRDGRFPPARLSAYQQMWDRDPDGTREFIKLMPKNSVPTLASAGLLGTEIDKNAADSAYDAYMGAVA